MQPAKTKKKRRGRAGRRDLKGTGFEDTVICRTSRKKGKDRERVCVCVSGSVKQVVFCLEKASLKDKIG